MATGTTVGAVSYTHLDVYKRQEQDRAAKKRYPAVNPIDSYSKYIEYPEFEEYITKHINGEWIEMCIRDRS